MPNMRVPNGYKSKDVIDRRNGEKPTLSERARDITIAVRDDWNDMRANQRDQAQRASKSSSRSTGRSSGR